MIPASQDFLGGGGDRQLQCYAYYDKGKRYTLTTIEIMSKQ